MTENKRFVDYFDKDHNYIIQDLWNEDEYQVGFVNCDEDLFLELVNELNDENNILKQKLKTKYIVNKQYEELQKVKKENEQLQSELSRYKEVNRLDIWKSSYNSEDALITELQDKCDKKQEHIVLLENKIHRMREAIHKLEWLASHRNADLKRENEQLKSFIKGTCIFCGANLRQQYIEKYGDIE